MSELRQVLMDRDGMTASEAEIEIMHIRNEVANGANPEEILYEYGLEPDYVLDIL